METLNLTARQLALLRFDDQVGHPDLEGLCLSLVQHGPESLIGLRLTPAKNLDLDTLLLRLQFLEAALTEDVLFSIEKLADDGRV